MSRNDDLLAAIDRSMRIIELGPLTAPVAPKQAGWTTTVVDHASREQLVEKYSRDPNVDTARIVDVDVVWSQGPLDEAFPSDLLGSYDAFIASHVFEHIPDPIGLLQSLARLLQPSGVVAFAIPDKRFCFDFFKPLSSVGELLDAHARRATRHSGKAIFNDIAYSVRADGEIAFRLRPVRELELFFALEEAKRAYDGQSEPDAPYADVHGWQFTPASFELAIVELAALGLIDYSIEHLFPGNGYEFVVALRRGASPLDGDELEERRLALLRRTVQELRVQAEMLSGRGPKRRWRRA